MSDLFHERVSDTFIAAVFGVMASARRHTFQVLTKRADVMQRWFVNVEREAQRQGFGRAIGEFCAFVAARAFGLDVRDEDSPTDDQWPLPNVWLGVSVEDQKHADLRIPQLLQTPAAVRFISAEPLLGPVNLLAGWLYHNPQFPQPLDWVIVGGESGPGARPFDLAWARSIVQQCQAAGVPVFVKQLGAKPREDEPVLARTSAGDFDDSITRDWKWRHKKGGDPAEWPDDLRVREFPEARA